MVTLHCSLGETVERGREIEESFPEIFSGAETNGVGRISVACEDSGARVVFEEGVWVHKETSQSELLCDL